MSTDRDTIFELATEEMDKHEQQKYIWVEEMLKAMETYRPEALYVLLKHGGNERHPIPIYTPSDILAGMWVPVTERLPEPFVDVLVLYDDGYCGVDFVSRGNGKFVVSGATYWMPLPQPPRKAGDPHV